MQWHWIISRSQIPWKLLAKWQIKKPIKFQQETDIRYTPALPMEVRIHLLAVQTPPPLCEAKTLGLFQEFISGHHEKGSQTIFFGQISSKRVSATVTFLSTFYLKGQVLHPIFRYFTKKPFPCPSPVFLTIYTIRRLIKWQLFDPWKDWEEVSDLPPIQRWQRDFLSRKREKASKEGKSLFLGSLFQVLYQYGNSFLIAPAPSFRPFHFFTIAK